MKDRERFFERAAEAVDILSIVQEGDVSAEITQMLVGLAQAEETARLADAIEESNRLKRIELGHENPQPGGVADRFTAVPDLSGQRPQDSPAG